MTGKLTVKESVKKKTKGGDVYLLVKSEQEKYYSIFRDNEYLWHLFTPGAVVEGVEIVQNGNFSNIVGVTGQGRPESSGGVAVPPNMNVWLEKLYNKMNDLEKKIDQIAEDKNAINFPPLDTKPKDDIDPKKIPF